MSAPFSVEDGLHWFLTTSPGASGMCARHSWRSLGGVHGNPPAWGAADANAMFAKIHDSGRFFTTEPPRGALIVWRYGRHGHAARGYGDGLIATTDPHGHLGGTGVEPLSYPAKWGGTPANRIWTDTYNGVRFLHAHEVSPDHAAASAHHEATSINLRNLVRGRTNDDVRSLQRALNNHLDGADLPITGFFGPKTGDAVRRCQRAHDLGEDRPGHEFVGPEQARHLGLLG